MVREIPCARSAPIALLILAVAAAFAAVASFGCASADALDRRINELVERRSASLGPNTVAPRREYPDPESLERPGQYEKTPETLNPAASDLYYDVAAEDRDVAERLAEYAQVPDTAIQVDLTAAFRLAQQTSREYLTAEEEYILAAIRLLIERHRWSPRFFDDLSASVGGSFDEDAETTLRIINELRVTQRLPYGGEVEAALIYSATQALRDAVDDEYTQSTALVLSGNIPLLRNAGLIAQEDLIQAERDLIYAARQFERFRREFLVDIASDFFDLVALQAGISNQIASLRSRQESARAEEERVEAGRRAAYAARNLRQNVLQAEQQLINQREAYIIAVDRFKIRLGIPVETPVVIIPSTIDPPEPEASPAEAALLAINYRLDLQNERDQIYDNRRAVSNARNQLLPDLDLNGAVTLNTFEDADDDTGGFDFRGDNSTYFASVTFGLPLDREIERLNLRSAIISLQRQIRAYSQFRDNIILDARAQRRRIDQQRFALQLAEERVALNELRLEQLKLQEGDALEITTAEDELLQSKNDVDNAIRDLRVAVLNYLLTTGQMRVAKEGTFLPLPGMVAATPLDPPVGPPPPPAAAPVTN
ncbi:MAG: TolC family protein [Planctomycetota bacterium]|nr:TolC family protein [Planctomycetota bacterium]